MHHALPYTGPLLLFALLAELTVSIAHATTLRVGRGQTFHAPSEAAGAVHDGDTVLIAPGEYYDCAVWRADDLVIAGEGPGVMLTDLACEGKAAFVLRGRRITLRDLTFTRIRVADGNGAGIRAEGGDVTTERGRFVDNQIGILAADSPNAWLILRGCEFLENGTPGATTDILTNRLDLLRIEQSTFRGGKGDALIASAAARTELVGVRIEAGPGARPFVVGALRGGSVAISDTDIVLTGVPPRVGIVTVAADDGWPTGDVTLRDVKLTNGTGVPAVLLRDWNGKSAYLAGNTLSAEDTEISRSGALLHRLKRVTHLALDGMRAVATRLHARATQMLHAFGVAHFRI